MMTRRNALKTTTLAAAACASAPSLNFAQQAASTQGTPPAGPFTLPPLPFAVDALEPHIDARTMEIHHGKHHAAYVANLNKAIGGEPRLGVLTVGEIIRDLDKVPEKIRTAVRNNGGGHFNHDLFWKMLKPGGGGQPTHELAKAIDKDFGGFSAFKEKLAEAATKVFGSGWAWLVMDDEGRLAITPTPNQDSPVMGSTSGQTKARIPLLGIDVWEHAYYLKYQNRRADYINAWCNVIHWDFVAERFARK
jgi:Fe-Mn family superoxide dismutase